jgi:hypothetical protein
LAWLGSLQLFMSFRFAKRARAAEAPPGEKDYNDLFRYNLSVRRSEAIIGVRAEKNKPLNRAEVDVYLRASDDLGSELRELVKDVARTTKEQYVDPLLGAASAAVQAVSDKLPSLPEPAKAALQEAKDAFPPFPSLPSLTSSQPAETRRAASQTQQETTPQPQQPAKVDVRVEQKPPPSQVPQPAPTLPQDSQAQHSQTQQRAPQRTTQPEPRSSVQQPQQPASSPGQQELQEMKKKQQEEDARKQQTGAVVVASKPEPERSWLANAVASLGEQQMSTGVLKFSSPKQEEHTWMEVTFCANPGSESHVAITKLLDEKSPPEEKASGLARFLAKQFNYVPFLPDAAAVALADRTSRLLVGWFPQPTEAEEELPSQVDAPPLPPE